jgi:hypothetical protein
VPILALDKVRRFAKQCRDRVGDVVRQIIPAEQQEIGTLQRQERLDEIGETVLWNDCTAPAKGPLDGVFRAVSSNGMNFIDRAMHSSFQ